MNRDFHTILYQILKPVEKKPQMKTAIMYKASLSTAQLNGYLKVVNDSDLLRYDKVQHKYAITSIGLRFIHLYEEMIKLIDFTRVPE